MRTKKEDVKPDLAAADHHLNAAKEADEDGSSLPSGAVSKTRKSEDPEPLGFLAQFDRMARITASIGVAGAAVIGVLQYIASNEDVRSERSLEVVREWKSDDMADRYTRVQDFVAQKLENTADELRALPDEARDRALINLGRVWVIQLRATGDPTGLERDIDQLTAFFAQMEVCIKADLCEAEVLKVYFAEEVLSFWAYFEGYALLRRKNNYGGYGTAVDRLVDRFERAN